MSNTRSAAYNHDEASSRLTELPGAAGTILAPPDGKRCPAVAVGATDRTKLHSDVVDALRIASPHAEVKPEAAPLPPRRLGETRSWVLWREVPRGPGQKPAKQPFQLDGRTPASTTNPATWASYAEARHALLNGAGRCDGLGFVLGNGVVGIDFDVDADDPQSREVIERFWGTYVERSPNGRLHVFALGAPQRSGKRGPAEVYGEGSPRYLTYTGQHIEGTAFEVTQQQAALDWFHETYFPEQPTTNAGNPAACGPKAFPFSFRQSLAEPAKIADNPAPTSKTAPAAALDDGEVIELASNAKNGDKFRPLFAGDFSGYPSQSEGDLALCAILAFWTNKDPAQIDRIFRRSRLFRPTKWDQKSSEGRTYGATTIEAGIRLCRTTYKPAKGKAKPAKTKDEDEGQGLFSRVIETVKRDPELKNVRFDILDNVSVLVDGSQIPPKMVLELRRKAETPRRTVGADLAQAALEYVARDRPFDPLLEMLEALPAWDGEYRLDTWPIRYLGARDDEVSRRCGRMWMVSLIARAYKPGCQAKYVLVLQGPQDLGKSRLVERLAGSPRFFMPMGGHEIGSRDTKLAISRKWIGEFAELGKLPMSERNVVKAFISDCSDTFRAPYARADITAPRRCVFVVTENPDGVGWLNDPTGGVRWWPIACTQIDFDAFDKDRDQLLAEARVAFFKDEPWWPETQIEGLLELQESLQKEDGWLYDIEAVLENSNRLREDGEITIQDVVFGLFCHWGKANPGDRSGWTPAQDQRVASCLKRLGFSPPPNPVWRSCTDPTSGRVEKRRVRPWRRSDTPE